MKVSEGCQHCYAETLAKRWKHDIWGPPATTHRRLFAAKHWTEPLRWNEAARKAGVQRRVFSGSMCDVFEDHPDVGAARVLLWDVIERTPNLIWLLLTKRPENIEGMLPAEWGESRWYQNVWLGTSVENQEQARARIPALLAVEGAARYFLSCEPLLEPLDLASILCEDGSRALRLIDWAIIGGESGPHFRPMDLDWALDIKQQCDHYGTKFFFKQRAGPKPGNLDGVPPELLVQEIPDA
jgi:protein gp37